MDQRNALLEEYPRNRCSSGDNRIFQIGIATLADAVALAPITWEACWAVNQEDLADFLVQEKGITHAEHRVYEWLNGGAQLTVAVIEEQFAGLLVSQNLGDRIEYIRMLYTRPEFEGLGVGKGLIHSLMPKRIVFRTRRDSPPQRCLAVTPQAKQICESSDWRLWSMEWRTRK